MVRHAALNVLRNLKTDDLAATIRGFPRNSSRLFALLGEVQSPLALDTMDLLTFLIALHKQFDVDIPMPDNSPLATIDDCLRHLTRKRPAGGSDETSSVSPLTSPTPSSTLCTSPATWRIREGRSPDSPASRRMPGTT
jgi:hypothetical protein